MEKELSITISKFIIKLGILQISSNDAEIMSYRCWNSYLISEKPLIFSARPHRMNAFRISGIVTWSIMKFASLTNVTAKFKKYGFPQSRIVLDGRGLSFQLLLKTKLFFLFTITSTYALEFLNYKLIQ